MYICSSRFAFVREYRVNTGCLETTGRSFAINDSPANIEANNGSTSDDHLHAIAREMSKNGQTTEQRSKEETKSGKLMLTRARGSIIAEQTRARLNSITTNSFFPMFSQFDVFVSQNTSIISKRERGRSSRSSCASITAIRLDYFIFLKRDATMILSVVEERPLSRTTNRRSNG